MVNRVFQKNYDKYDRIAKNILYNSPHNTKLSSVLLSDCYMYLIENEIDGTEQYLDSVIINWINCQVKWSNTNFNKENKIKDLIINDDWNQQEDILSNIEYDEYDEQEDIEFEKMIDHIKQRSKNLDMIGTTLYTLSIIGEYNTSGKLSKLTKLNRTTCYYLIRDLKTYLKDGYND